MNPVKLIVIGVLTMLVTGSANSQIRANIILKFKIPGRVPEGNYYVMTKDSVKHTYSDIDGFKLIKKKRYVLNDNESYASDDVIAYKAIYKRYGGAKDFVLEYSRIDGVMVPKYVSGRINVFDNIDMMGDISRRTYYLQKGENGQIVELTKENVKTLIYDMLKDYEPSKDIMDKSGSSFKAVEEAVNAYNIRAEDKKAE